MSFPFGNPFARLREVDTGGARILGLSSNGRDVIVAAPGHSLTLAANGAGKTTRVAMPALFSFAADPTSATMVLDSKDGEIAAQAAPMLHATGCRVYVIDDSEVRPELSQFRISLNLFGGALAAYRRDPRDAVFPIETIANVLIPEPAEGPDKNKHFRDVPREINEFCTHMMLGRNLGATTPGAIAAIVIDPDMLITLARAEAEEGSPAVQALARSVIEMSSAENWGQHLSEARRSLRLFAPGTRLHDVGLDATKTHEDLIREKAVIFLVGPQSRMDRMGPYYSLHIMGFIDALYQGAGKLRIIGDEFTNCPLKQMVTSLTTLRAYGGEVHMIAQSRSEIIRKFGEQECRTLEENSITKQYLGFSSFEEAERVSKAIGEEHAVASGLSGDTDGIKSQTNLSLIKQRWMSPAELMALPPDLQLIHIKGVGFFLAPTIAQNQIAPYCHKLAPNPLEGGVLPPDPKIRLAVPRTARRGWL